MLCLQVMEGSTLDRVSLDLMGDPDIQNMFQKSYSLEDLTLVDAAEEQEEEDEVEEEGEDAAQRVSCDMGKYIL